MKALDAALTVALKESDSPKIISLLVAAHDGGNADHVAGEDDVQRKPTFHLRLAKLLMDSKEWDAKRGKALKGGTEALILKLLQKNNPMPELFEVFKKHSLRLTYKLVEESRTLLTRASGKFYPSIGAKPTDVFPDDMNIYFKVESL